MEGKYYQYPIKLQANNNFICCLTEFQRHRKHYFRFKEPNTCSQLLLKRFFMTDFQECFVS